LAKVNLGVAGEMIKRQQGIKQGEGGKGAGGTVEDPQKETPLCSARLHCS